MERKLDELPANHNLKCHICGENKFEEREGFYYCQECGTKQEQVRLIEIENNDEFDPEKLKTKKTKIQVTKTEKPQLTSWECYNYILRGFVEELLSFGAKEELKLMTLQVWAAYLRRMEVAFFNRKQPDLPKLGIKYFQNDAKTIYNHSKRARAKRKRRRSEDTSCTSGGESRSTRDWNRSKRKLDESNYSLTSVTSAGSGLTSSTSGNSTRALKIGFSAKARSYLKRKMPAKHIAKHAADAEGLLTCHKQPSYLEMNRTDYKLMLVNIKQVYAIIAISLNLIGDEIQLCDLVRFINEGHISKFNVLQYFPENIASNGKEMLKNVNFYKNHEKYSDKALRDHIGILRKHLGIYTLQTPNIIKLVQRYTKELCLPKVFADYIERLINFLPPNFANRSLGNYPGFEARAMAYIIFTLKLLFGLDDSKEHRISRASKNINSKIVYLNSQRQENQPLLFVWDEWVEYIEMRKIIVSQFNTSFCEQFKQSQSANQVLEGMAEEMHKAEENNNLLNDISENMNCTQKLKYLRSIMERFQESYKNSEHSNSIRIDFKPSLTPALSYMKNILLFYDRETNSNSSINIKIPTFMHIDHSQRDIYSYLQVKPLIKYFKNNQLNLKVHVIATTKNKEYVGIFRSHRNTNPQKIYKACLEVTQEEWCNAIATRIKMDDIEFITDLKPCSAAYNEKKSRQSNRAPFFDPFMSYDLTMIRDTADDEGNNEKMPNNKQSGNDFNERQDKTNQPSQESKEHLESIHSFELFSENNMDPIDNKNFLTRPRRNLENIDLFEGIKDEESVLNSDDGDDENMDGNDTLLSSPNLEEFIKIEPNSSTEALQTTMKDSGKDNNSKRDNALKMYISNMDCWMMLGCLSSSTKMHNTQLQNKFPRSFKWLLETCAQTINVEWLAVFEQLLCIETMFGLGINDTETTRNCIYLNSHISIKNIQALVATYRAIW